jgi:signal recognition particle receptor subunit beta
MTCSLAACLERVRHLERSCPYQDRGTLSPVAQVNPLTREVLIKLVYYGPGLGGKTTTLQKVHSVSPAETRGKIVSLATPVDRTLYFDFMPLRVEPVHGYPVRLQLFTVPGQVYFNATRKLVLTGADGVVFVADSKRDRQDANLESLQNLEANLQEQGRSLSGVPHVMQFNKRDLDSICSVDELNGALNAHAAPSFASAASLGEGVVEPLDELVRLVLTDLERRAVFGGEPTPAAQARFGASSEGLRASLTRVSEQWDDEPIAVQLSAPARDTAVLARSSSPPQRRSTPARGIHVSALPVGRTQSSEPPRVPTFEARSLSALPSQLPVTQGPSWAALFPLEQTKEITQLEQDLVQGDFRAATLRCDALFAENLAEAADDLALEVSERQPAVVALCLGLPADRVREFRAAVRRARSGAEIAEREVLDAYATLIELSRLRLRVQR